MRWRTYEASFPGSTQYWEHRTWCIKNVSCCKILIYDHWFLAMHLNPSSKNREGHFFQGDNHFLYTGSHPCHYHKLCITIRMLLFNPLCWMCKLPCYQCLNHVPWFIKFHCFIYHELILAEISHDSFTCRSSAKIVSFLRHTQHL
jgi:hypothetical protein